ncbi:MAG: methyltransferase domain-containing protein, partial [Patescibacteria group bacterium]
NLTRQMPFCNFSRQNLLQTNFAAHAFDAIVALDVLEHIQFIEKALTEIKRILKTQKYLITSEPTESILYKTLRFMTKGTFSMETGPGAGKHYYQAREIDIRVTSLGFKKINSKKIPLPYPLDLFHINLYQKI